MNKCIFSIDFTNFDGESIKSVMWLIEALEKFIWLRNTKLTSYNTDNHAQQQ